MPREDLFSEANGASEGHGAPLEDAQGERHAARIDHRLCERAPKLGGVVIAGAYGSQERVGEGRRFERMLTRLLTRPCFFREKVVEALGIEIR
jgi:hypothetical protein